MFESNDDAQKNPNTKQKNKQLTIGEAVNGIEAGDAIPDGPLSPSTNSASGKSKYGSLRSNKSASGKGKGKGKAISAFGAGADSDADADDDHDAVRNGVNGVKAKGKGKSSVTVDGEDDNEDEYLVKTDHLVDS